MQRIIDIARSSPAVLLIQISRLNVIKTQQNKELVLVVDTQYWYKFLPSKALRLIIRIRT